jgi:hypothetical protein
LGGGFYYWEGFTLTPKTNHLSLTVDFSYGTLWFFSFGFAEHRIGWFCTTIQAEKNKKEIER